jgi:hypothetical protein
MPPSNRPAPSIFRRRPPVRESGNALIIAIIFIAVFSIIAGALQLLSDQTNRLTAREDHFVSTQVAADAALDVIYGRFSQWIDAHTGLTPSLTDVATAGVPGNTSFPAITSAISFSGINNLSSYTVSKISLVPLMPDDTAGSNFPSWSTWQTNPSTYQSLVNPYYVLIPNIYATNTFSNALTYLATVTITPAKIDYLHPGAITVSRYFQSSQVSPFTYNIFTEGTFEDYDWGQSFDSEANIYASTTIKLDDPGTIVNGPMRYGTSFIDPTGTVGGVNELVFQDPITGANVSPYTSGLVKQVSDIEVVPDLTDVIAHNSDGSRSASMEFAAATDDDFSRREIIEPPANLSGDTAPQQIAERRIYTQADVRLKVSVATKTVVVSGQPTVVTTATGTFYDTSGNIVAQYTGNPASATQTTWTATQGGNATTSGVIAAVNVNPVNSSTPFYDPTRRYDNTSLYTGQPGQPTTANTGNAVEAVDVNVGTLTSVINSNQSSFATNTVYVWDDGSSGQKNGVVLYNGGILPNNGLTVGSTDPVYVKGDYNTGSVLATPSSINSATTATQPAANTLGWDNGDMATTAQNFVTGYTPKPAGIFGDTITTLSQNWRDASSASGTQYACSTTYNAVLGFGSGDINSLLPNDSFSNGAYSTVQSLEMWNNCRWNQQGEQMSLYHSIYNLHKNPPAWLNGGFIVIQNEFNPMSARLPLKWGYLVFNRGRYVRD